jgi:CDP-diacylglycerol--glycerol-3-phosphate 3-phosphatidyltransferase
MHTAAPRHPEGLTLATKVTLVRLMGVPVFVLLLVYYILSLRAGAENDWLRVAALLVFAAVAATDALDGYLARSRNEITTLGKVLDPLADKALLLSGLILLTRPSLPGLTPHIPVWLTTLLISRDVILFAGYWLIHHFAARVEVRPRWSGKTATVMQMGVILWVLMQAPATGFSAFAALTGLCSGLAFLQYAADGIRQLGRVGHA